MYHQRPAMCESPAINVGLREDAEPNTVCHADDLVGWRDFPKGLKVLLVEDRSSRADIKSKLEQMDYIGKTTSTVRLHSHSFRQPKPLIQQGV